MKENKSFMFEAKLTSGQLILINKMISERRLAASKEQIMLQVTSGRTDNVRELFVSEATDVIRFLKSGKTASFTAPPVES